MSYAKQLLDTYPRDFLAGITALIPRRRSSRRALGYE
jgi:hypothetical protein